MKREDDEPKRKAETLDNFCDKLEQKLRFSSPTQDETTEFALIYMEILNEFCYLTPR